MSPSTTHLVLIPSYNTGPRLLSTVAAARAQWNPVWIVVDGSTDQSHEPVLALAQTDPGLRVILRPRNGGKGAAVLTGAETALAAGFTHVLTMDSDGQHPADHIAPFMQASLAQPAALVLGKPIFGPEVPLERLHGRKLSVGLARLEILGAGIDDPLFGFRVYPAMPLLKALRSTRRARGFDFDPEVAVRMVWAGVPTVNLPAPCRYLTKADGGVSHFHYLRDNLKLIWLHTRLLSQLLWRWPALLARRHQTESAVKIVSFLFLCCLAPAVFAATEPPPAPPPALTALTADNEATWRELFKQLAPGSSRFALFEERRYLPFRKTPVVLKGEIRISPERGLSLRYLGDEEKIMILDRQGIVLRDDKGRTRTLPTDARSQAANVVLLDAMRLDFDQLQKNFATAGAITGDTWTLQLTPRDSAAADSLGVLTLQGDHHHLLHIEIKRGSGRIEILCGETKDDVAFTALELVRYFR